MQEFLLCDAEVACHANIQATCLAEYTAEILLFLTTTHYYPGFLRIHAPA